jgi:hypothetical protein
MLGWRAMATARPTTAHRALARLECAGRIQMLVTQNVDGLHNRAGSTRVVDLHGRIDTVCCLGCGARSPRQALQDELVGRNPHWLAQDARSAPDGDADLDANDFAEFDVPACTHCGGMLKPDVVFFGESVPRIGLRLGLGRLVALHRGIARQFTAERRWAASQFCCNARLADALALEAVNLVSFFLGQVGIGHGATFRTGWS